MSDYYWGEPRWDRVSPNEMLKELWMIANDLTEGHINHDPYGDHTCKYCGGISATFDKESIKHHESCPILKLEQFREKHKVALWATTHP